MKILAILSSLLISHVTQGTPVLDSDNDEGSFAKAKSWKVKGTKSKRSKRRHTKKGKKNVDVCPQLLR